MAEFAITIDLSRTRLFEAGAIVLALLALPKAAEEARGGMIFSLCHLALRETYNLTTPDALVEQSLKPVYVFRSEVEMRRDLRTFDRRLRDRLIAGEMALALLKRAVGELPEVLPPGLDGFTLAELSTWAERHLPESRILGGVHEPANTESRIWRASLPVIHFAAALAILSQAWARQDSGQLHPLQILLHPPLVKWLIEEADRLGTLVEGSGIMGRKPVPLVKVRLTVA